MPTTTTYTATFTPNVYRVDLNFNGGTYVRGSIFAMATFDAAMPPMGGFPPVRAGYTFAGYWDTSVASGGTRYYNDMLASVRNWDKAASTTLYAQWTSNTYTVRYNANTGTGTMADQTHTYGTSLALRPNTFTKTGYLFAGWSTTPAGPAMYQNGQSVRDLTTVNGATVTLYAVWTQPYLSNTPAATTAKPIIATAYSGFAYKNAGKAVQGTVTLNAKAAVKVDRAAGLPVINWTWSAKVLLQDVTLSFAGTKVGAADRFTGITRTGETLDVLMYANRFHGTLKEGRVGATGLLVDGARNRFADKTDAGAAICLSTLHPSGTALYDVVLGDTAVAGFISLSVAKTGAVKLAGRLDDGTAISGSATLLHGLNGSSWLAIALHRPLYSKKGYIGGLLWLNPTDKLIYIDTAQGWYLDWVRDAPSKPLGLDFTRSLSVYGSYFGDGKTSPTLPAGLELSAATPATLPTPVTTLLAPAWQSAAYLENLAVIPSGKGLGVPKGAAPKNMGGVMVYNAVNPSAATLSYTAKTGVFKGAFKMYYEGIGAKGEQVLTYNVPYTGMVMDPGAAIIVGYGVGPLSVSKTFKPTSIPVMLHK
jgi:uncharacterized repeat protein (TIGR02543 family)